MTQHTIYTLIYRNNMPVLRLLINQFFLLLAKIHEIKDNTK